MAKKTYYITTTIPYANAGPHIGHALEFCQADFLARWNKQLGNSVFFLTGTDEHGSKIYKTAKEKGVSPQKFVDKNAKLFENLLVALNISNDGFIRTTDRKKHWPGVFHIWNKLVKKGDIYKKEYSGLYCTGCERYVTEKELVNGRCPDHPTLRVETISESNYFFKLSKYSDKIVKLIETGKLDITPLTWRNDFLALAKKGLQDVSFSRSAEVLPWGVPVPSDDSQVMYVWCDALTNYLTGIGYPNKKYETWWPADVHVVGKDMHRFHAGIWPGMLLSAGIPLPKRLLTHGFLTVNGQKMSKSTGNTIDPFEIIEKYGVDAARYYFLREIPSGQDGDVSEKAMLERYNSELANEFGNLVSRVAGMITKYYGGEIPRGKVKLKAKLPHGLVKNFEINRAAENIWGFIRKVNKYIQDNKPWELKGKKRDNVLLNCACALRDIIALVWPFVPDGAEKAAEQLGLKGVPAFKDIGKPLKGRVKKGAAVYPRLTAVEEQELKFNLDIRGGKITAVEKVPKSSKLYKLQIDFGAFKRQAVAGLMPYFKPSELKGKKFAFLVNLAPAKLAGIKSECMILAVEDKDKVDLLVPTGKIELEGYVSEPTKKVSLKDFSGYKFKVRDGKVVSRASILSGVKSKFKKGIVA